MTVGLSADEALALFECLSRWEAAGGASQLVDQAERIVLWSIEAQLEKALVEPLHPDYPAQVEAARRRVRGAGSGE